MQLSGTDSDNTVEYGQDEFENVEVEAAEDEAMKATAIH